jgi:putative GTP pyrophosphokinase
MTPNFDGEYEKRFSKVLQPVAKQLQAVIEGHLEYTPRIDRVSARAKSPVRFLAKARRRNDDDTAKYSDPMEQIQDQIGARVIVFYLSDVEEVTKVVMKYFRHIEIRQIVPDDLWSFGYFGKHFILKLPAEAVPSSIDRSLAPEFFELQVKTLWQHAWSESEHDLGYKAPGELLADQQRRLAFTSAQAWGADRIFEELFGELHAGSS